MVYITLYAIMPKNHFSPVKKKVYGKPPSLNNISYKKLSCLLLLPNHWDLQQATKEGKTLVD